MPTPEELEAEKAELNKQYAGLAEVLGATGTAMEAIRERLKEIDQQLAGKADPTVAEKVKALDDLVVLGSVAAIAEKVAPKPVVAPIQEEPLIG